MRSAHSLVTRCQKRIQIKFCEQWFSDIPHLAENRKAKKTTTKNNRLLQNRQQSQFIFSFFFKFVMVDIYTTVENVQDALKRAS